ncbi:MAG: SCO family protein [Opitutaceae bacterium]
MKSNALVPAAMVALVLAACSKSASPDAPKVAATSTVAAGAPAVKGEKRFPLTGEVIRAEAERKVLVVKHEAIEGYMPAMTMEFKVAAGDATIVKPGQRIRAELVAPADGDFRLEKIWPDDKATADAVAAGARKLREDTHNLGKNAYREIGEQVPNFSLFDQDGRVVQSARFGGKQIMLNFIFTRCPDATKCPVATAKMMALQKLGAEAKVPNLELISITLDPAYDTPGVLKEYAAARGIDTKNFSFLTGPENAIRDLLTQFGVIAEFKGDVLAHSLVTLLIDEKGNIVHRADGSLWEPKDFVAKMRR